MTTPQFVRYELRVEKGQELVEKRELATRSDITSMLSTLAQAITEGTPRMETLALVGIRTGGFTLAERLRDIIAGSHGRAPLLGAIDITLYRDDVFVGLPKPQVGQTHLPFNLAGVTVVLVDDVLFTGRTVRAALDALNDFGRPNRVELAVLVDRGRRELPIEANFVGMTVETSESESIRVHLSDGTAGREAVILRGLEAGHG